MLGQACTAARGQGRPCRADGVGREKGGCCGARLCRRVPEPRGEPTWGRGSSSPGPSRRGQERSRLGHAGGAQGSAQLARARTPRGSQCQSVLSGKSFTVTSAAPCTVPAGTGSVAGPALGQHSLAF